jgi:fatty-acyl-CoA synthase
MSDDQVRVAGGLTLPLRRHARVNGNSIALRTPGRDVSYRDLDSEINRVAAGMANVGLGHGGKVAIFMANSVEWLVAYLATARIGAIVAPINVLASSSEADDILSEIECDVLVTTPELYARCSHDIARWTVIVGPSEEPQYDNQLHWASLFEHGSFDGPGPAASDIASLYYSSATTGRSKAAVGLHTDITLNSMQQVIELGLTSNDVHLVTASMSWAAGLHGVTLATLYAGGTIVLPELGAMTADKLASAIAEWRPTTVILVPTLLRRLVEDSEALGRLQQSNLRLILTGSEPVPLPLFERVTEELPDVEVMQGYGMSEFPMLITLLRPEHAAERVGSAGLPTMFTELALLQDDGTRVETGEGEILLRTPATMRRYWKRPEETEIGMSDGWLHTGDLGRIDADGFLWITGRAKDLIITGGLNVAPLEIEKVLTRALAGREVAVVGVADPEYGERIVAVFGGEEPVDSDEMAGICKETLPSYKVPREFYTFGDELPKGPTGKMLKRAIRPWAQDRSDERREQK